MQKSMVIRIEPQKIAHAEGLYLALQDRRIYEFLDDKAPDSIQAVRQRIEWLLVGAPASSGEVWMNWTVFENTIVLGYTQATIRDDGTASLAYALSPSVWGRSVAHTACKLTLAEIETLTSIAKIIADTEVRNMRSQALLERLGFQRTHEDEQDVYYKRTSG